MSPRRPSSKGSKQEPSKAAAESLSLRESSGPVAPPYQHKLAVDLTSTASGIRLVYRDEAEWLGGVPQRARSFDGLLTTAVWAKLRADLLAAGLLGLSSSDALGPPAGRVGVSTNELVLVQHGQAPVRISYSLPGLARPEGKSLAAIVARLKQLVAETS